ncbi:Aquacobalamin reductase [Saliniradius amylolyticus]|uniref:Aquacobalamin reductase n=1 Tax=Saliniradius amylolyticus TaxID=2183582 RepID=A0A2S2E6W8_9ALTE|nr:NAD(P)H-flavin reductase [Saliniradius amylolyticus]AWL13394.1 Aquacobalamin reductase [Saliniradius amylolyticus]
MAEINCKVARIDTLTPTVYRIELKPEQPLEFKAGQYVLVVMEDDDKRPFSIANAPSSDGIIELHIGASEHNPWAMEVVDRMQNHEVIQIDAPHGEAYLREAEQTPRILIAGGTGFSYTRSIALHLLESDLTAPVTLYWGVRMEADMYDYDELIEFEKQHPEFHFVPVVQEPGKDWQGRTGLVHEAVAEDFADMSQHQVYIAGRFEMAKVARDEFEDHGLKLTNLFGDAYSFI